MINNLVIIDDDPIITEMLEDIVKERLHVHTESYCSAEQFFADHAKSPNSVYLVDWNLPGLQGPEIVKEIRKNDKLSPIFMISGNVDRSHVLEGLKSGADDYIVKPFMTEELMAKLENARMKTDTIMESLLNVGLKVFPEGNLVMKDGVSAGLTAREFLVFNVLYQNPGKVVSRHEIISLFIDGETTERNVDVVVFSVRKKLQLAGIDLEVETVRGQGYRMSENRS